MRKLPTHPIPETTLEFEPDSLGLWLDASLQWVVDAILDGDVDDSASFFELDPQAQFLAVQVLRTAVRAALEVGAIERTGFVAATTETFRSWLTPTLERRG